MYLEHFHLYSWFVYDDKMILYRRMAACIFHILHALLESLGPLL